MTVELTTTKLFEILGSVYAEVRVLAEDNTRLSAENAVLTAAVPQPATDEVKPKQRKAK